MKRLFQVLLVLIIMGQTVIASADMVVFWGSYVVDRSNISAIVQKHKSGQIEVIFRGGDIGSGVYLCKDKYDDKLKDKTIAVILKALDKDKHINPDDILKNAGLTGCK